MDTEMEGNEVELKSLRFRYCLDSLRFLYLNDAGRTFLKIDSPTDFDIREHLHANDLQAITHHIAGYDILNSKPISCCIRFKNKKDWQILLVYFRVYLEGGKKYIEGYANEIQSGVINFEILLEVSNDSYKYAELFKNLTSREKTIMQLICDGLRNHEIADQLNISIHTVKTHRKSLNRKLSITNSMELHKYCNLVKP